jgi:hypothetical protein
VIPGEQVIDLGDDIIESHQLGIAGAAGTGLLGRLQRHVAGELARARLVLVLGEEVEIDCGQIDLVVELLGADHRSQVAQVDGQLLQRWVFVVDDLRQEVVLP